MNIQQVVNEGYKLYTFPITDEQLTEWQILAPHIPLEERIDCIISSLALLKLVNRQRAEIISHNLHALPLEMDLLPREVSYYFIRDKLHDYEFDKTGIEYQIIFHKFSLRSVMAQLFKPFKDFLPNNSGTIIILEQLSEHFPFEPIGTTHIIILAKNAIGELRLIDPQVDPILIIQGDQAMLEYLTEKGYTNYLLYFRGRVIDSYHAKIPKVKTSVKTKSLNTISSKAAKDTRESFFQQKKDYRKNTLTRKRGIGRGKKSRKNKK